MNLVLVVQGQAVTGFLSIITGPFAARLAKAAGRCAQVGTGTAEVLSQIVGQIPEKRFEMLGPGTEKNDVTGGTVKVRNAGSMLLPYIHQTAQMIGRIIF